MNGEIEKQIEEGAKGKLGILITGTAITAFAASSLYVLGLSISMHQSLASHFDIFDYIQITPAWALPALVALLVCSLPVIPIWFLVRLIRQGRKRGFLAGLVSLFDKRGFLAELESLFDVLLVVYLFFLVLGLSGMAVITWHDLFPKNIPKTLLLIAADALVVVGITWLVPMYMYFLFFLFGAFAPKFAPKFPAEFAPVLRFEKKIEEELEAKGQLGLLTGLRIITGVLTAVLTVLFAPGLRIITAVLTVLCFAFSYGAIVAPALVRAGTEVTVYLKQEGPSVGGKIDLPHANAKISLDQKELYRTGRIVLMLSRRLILLTELRAKSILVIPEEKIERIDIPAARYFGEVTPSASPTP